MASPHSSSESQSDSASLNLRRICGSTTAPSIISKTSGTRLSATTDGTLNSKILNRPIRKKITGLPAFTTVKGGAHFFLPGTNALRYLSTVGTVIQENAL